MTGDVSEDGPTVCSVPRAAPIGTTEAPNPVDVGEAVSCVAAENLDGLLDSGDETGGVPGHLPSSSWKMDDPCGWVTTGRGPPIAGGNFLPDTL